MSSNALLTPAQRGYQGTQPRYANSRDDGEADSVQREHSNSPRSDIFAQDVTDLPIGIVCTLGIHDELFSKDEVLLNFSLFDTSRIAVGTPIRMTALEADSPSRSSKHYGARGSSAEQKQRVFGSHLIMAPCRIQGNTG